MQGKFPRSALLIASFVALSLSTSGVYAGNAGRDPGYHASVKSAQKSKVVNKRKARQATVSLPSKAPIPSVRPGNRKFAKPAKPVNRKNTSPKKLPVAATAPVPENLDYSRIKESVQNTVKGLEILEGEKQAKMPQVDKPAETSGDVVRGFAALGFANSDWEEGVEGFRFHAAAARRLMSEGRPDLAVAEIAFAKDKATEAGEIAEAGRLLSVADVLIGKEVQSSIVRGAAFPVDWKAMEVARAGISGEKPAYPVLVAIDEVSKWPDPLAALVIRHFAPLVDKRSADALIAVADRLNASGSLNPSVLPLIRGYVYKMAGEADKAKSAFEAASTSVLGGVSGRAKLELLEAGIKGNAFSKNEIAAAATDIVNIRTNDVVERRALRILADNVTGADKINALRSLEKIEPNVERKTEISLELDKLIEEIALAEKAEEEKRMAEAEKQKKAEDKAPEVQKSEPTWLLEEEGDEKKAPSKGKVSIKSINQSLSEADDIVRSFKEQK